MNYLVCASCLNVSVPLPGAQVRHQYFVEMTPLLLVCFVKDEPDFLVIDPFVPYSVGHLTFLLSWEVWLPLSEADFV